MSGDLVKKMPRSHNNSDQMAQVLQPDSHGATRPWGEPGPPQRDFGPTTCTLDKMKKLPESQCHLGPLMFNRAHTVLINVEEFNCKRIIKPQEGMEIWSSVVVKMPHSSSNLMTVRKGISQEVTNVIRWKVISKELKVLAKKKAVDVQDVQKAILMYNQKYKAHWSFDALDKFVMRIPKTENYFDSLFPKIAALALKLPEHVKKAIPMLHRGHPASITLSQVQIACLLANAFFCTFPHRNTTSSRGEYHRFPTINFNSLFGNWSERKKEKLRAIMHYFKVVTDENTKLDGLVTFERRCLPDTDMQTWKSCDQVMPRMHITSHGTIENEGTGLLQVDFASSWIGGGVLSAGLLQEEILFLMNPELIVSRLFTERLADNECLIITGSQKFSNSTGYGDSFEWAGPCEDSVPRDEWARRRRQILAIDAEHYTQGREQYNMHSVLRELTKAYCGFRPTCAGEPDIATGKWGCGAFNGDPQLKAMIQMMAAARARRGLAFFTFMDETLKEDLEKIYQLLVTEGVTVGKLFEHLRNFCRIFPTKKVQDGLLFDFIRDALKRSWSLL
ncbi:poly(ADP-ribose) glycohydrolase-like isoform X2 [Nelusetta ayraudi]|uniref:poly(ADP-ribose) glycohydrolase-like isoform X2 n=1 Tax=Nelusetta ayraudi TaxID=303726 RepID=UPI003F71A7B5